MHHFVLTAALALAASPLAAERAMVNGIDTYYEVTGSGTPLVVLHGAHMNLDTMGAVIPLLAETHKVYAMEFQGHGRTADIDRPITYENLADDVDAFMAEVGLQRADIFGYSMGAGAALQLAARHPQRVERLVLVSTGFDEAGFAPEMAAMIPQMAPETFEPFREPWAALAPDPAAWDGFIGRMIALEHEPLHWAEDVAGIEAPALIVAGDSDVVTLEHVVELFKLMGGGVTGDMGVPLSDSRLAILPATSHTAVIGQAELLRDMTEAFLAGEVPAGMFDQ